MKKYIVLIAIILAVALCAGCVTKDAEASAPPAPERFTVTFDGAVGDGWIQVMHDNELNTTIYRSADGYGYQGIAVISDSDL